MGQNSVQVHMGIDKSGSEHMVRGIQDIVVWKLRAAAQR